MPISPSYNYLRQRWCVLQRLLSCPGTAALGRGVAVMPATALRQMGAPSALMHLASDAVRAAAESPFLESSIGRASAVLCCLSLPPAPAPRSSGGSRALYIPAYHGIKRCERRTQAGTHPSQRGQSHYCICARHLLSLGRWKCVDGCVALQGVLALLREAAGAASMPRGTQRVWRSRRRRER